jgi:hypothetical protein
MDHQEATRMQAPTRYVLGELSPSEQEGFEEHFFTCQECAEELKAGAIFAENARAVFRGQIRRPTATSPAGLPQRGLGWWNWLRPQLALPVAALATLICIVGYQNAVTIPHLKLLAASQPVLSFPLKIARGDQDIVIPRNDESFMLYFYLPQDAQAGTYICTIERESGGGKRRLSLLSPQPGQPFTILLRRSEFSTGAYVARVYLLNKETELATYRFNLRID